MSTIALTEVAEKTEPIEARVNVQSDVSDRIERMLAILRENNVHQLATEIDLYAKGMSSEKTEGWKIHDADTGSC